MKFKIYFLIFILTLVIKPCGAQEYSLQTELDSLQIKDIARDSLNIQTPVDSLVNMDLKIDSSDYLDLFTKVEEYKTKSRKAYLADSNKELFWSNQGHLFGLASDNYHIRRDNFTELNSLYPSYLKLQNYNRFYQENTHDYFLDLSKAYYELPITAIEVVASTGDYDLGTGYFALKKNKFLDKYNLDFRMNFLKGDFYQGSELASNTSANLIIPFSNTSLDLAYNSIAYEGPFYRLSPAFMLNTSIFEENSQSISALFRNNYVNFGLKYSSETYKRIIEERLQRDYLQILINKDFLTEHWQTNLYYEFFLGHADFYSQEMNSLSSDIEQLIDFKLTSSYDRSNFSHRLVIAKPYQLSTTSEISHKFKENYTLVAFSNFRETLEKSHLFKNSLSEIIQDSQGNSEYSFYYLNEKKNNGLAFSFASDIFDFQLALSNTSIESKIVNSQYQKDFQVLKTELNGEFKETFGKYSLKLASKMRFYQEYENENIYYLPKANLTNSLDIARDMNHDNFIKAGIAHHFFDSYLVYDEDIEILQPETSLLDLYLAFQISKQFEISTYWKNILNNEIITGYRTIPQSITVLMSWNFLN